MCYILAYKALFCEFHANRSFNDSLQEFQIHHFQGYTRAVSESQSSLRVEDLYLELSIRKHVSHWKFQDRSTSDQCSYVLFEKFSVLQTNQLVLSWRSSHDMDWCKSSHPMKIWGLFTVLLRVFISFTALYAQKSTSIYGNTVCPLVDVNTTTIWRDLPELPDHIRKECSEYTH